MNCVLIGRIGKDVEVKYTKAGDAVTDISLAVNYGKTGDDGSKPTQWFKCSLWGKRAESLAPYLKKGTQVCLTVQDLHIETFQSEKGQGASLLCRVVDVALLGGGKQIAEQVAASKPVAKTNKQDEFEDDIPF